MKKILANAQFFGFAPTSLLLAVLDTLHTKYPGAYDIAIVDNPHLSVLLRDRTHPYTIVSVGDTPLLTYLFNAGAQEQYDAFLSFYDPTPMAYAWFYDKPRILYDGLFHFWDESSFNNTIRTDLEHADQAKLSSDTHMLTKWHDALWRKNPHEMLFGGHFFADLQFIRKTAAIEDRLEKYPELKDKLIPVGAIVNPHSVIPRSHAERDTMVISLGGSLNPIVSLEQNLEYARRVLSLISTAAQGALKIYKWEFICHPKIYDALDRNSLKSEGIRIRRSLSQPEYFSLLARSIGAFVPPSYTAIQEAAYFHVPVFLLPEQNGGQPHCFENLKKFQYPYKSNMTVGDLTGKYFTEFEVDQMYAAIQTIDTTPEIHQKVTRRIEEFGAIVTDPARFKQIVDMQRAAVTSLLGDFNGAQTIATLVVNYLNKA